MRLLPIMAIVGFLAALETAIPAWRNSAATSTAPVFSLPMMTEAIKNPGDFQTAIDVYSADRGGELKLPGPDATSLTVFYFEWDQVEAGPLMGIANHEPELCNVGAGFSLESVDEVRAFDVGKHGTILFDATTFKDPAGNLVYIFKNLWIQGLGNWDIRQGEHRGGRIMKSFARGRGAARVLQCGVLGASHQAHAWQIFHSEVLGNLVWKQ